MDGTGAWEVFKDVGGWAVAVLLALMTFLQNHKKTSVDEVQMVLSNWKELTEKHQEQLKLLTDEVELLRARIRMLEAELDEKLDHIRALKKELIAEKRRLSREGIKDAITKSLGGVPDDREEKGN